MNKDIESLFNKYLGEYLQFERIENKPSNRSDLCAFILLDKLFPSINTKDIISATEHDTIYLNFSPNEIQTLTDESIIYLMRCGVSFNSEYYSLYCNV